MPTTKPTTDTPELKIGGVTFRIISEPDITVTSGAELVDLWARIPRDQWSSIVVSVLTLGDKGEVVSRKYATLRQWHEWMAEAARQVREETK